jgi:superfamily II DNA or RNA helicase
VSGLSSRARAAVIAFGKPLVEWKRETKFGQTFQVKDKVFAAYNQAQTYFRFHINLLEQFKANLRQCHVPEDLVEWVVEADPVPKKVELRMRPGLTPRDDQPAIIDYLINTPFKSRQVGLQTGGGKGFVSMVAMCELGVRTCCILQAKYMEKWAKEFEEKMLLGPGDLVMVKTKDQLQILLEKLKYDDIDAKIIIVSSNIMGMWIEEYEQLGDQTLAENWACRPQEFFGHLKAGLKLVDEVHEHFHKLFVIDCYTHVPMSIALSATLVTRDQFIQQMHEIMFPRQERAPTIALKKFTDIYNVWYNLKNPESIRFTHPGRRDYSHLAFEKSIMRYTPTLLNYMRLYELVFTGSYMPHKRAGKKFVAYSASTGLCSKLTEWFSKKYPQYDIKRYCASLKDSYQKNAIDADVRFSTPGSAGTAIDIPGLVTCLLGIAIDSVQANIQILGRLRELKESSPGADDASTSFYCLTCSEIEKHGEYLRRRKPLYRERGRSYHEVNSGVVV